VMRAAEYGSLHDLVSDWQTVSVLVGRDLVRDGLRQTGALARNAVSPGLSCVVQSRRIICRWRSWKGIKKSRRRLPPSRSHTEFTVWGPQRRPQNSRTQVRKALVDVVSEDAIAIVDGEAVGISPGSASGNCWSVHSAEGWAVAL
jgi:hypothetical protein